MTNRAPPLSGIISMLAIMVPVWVVVWSLV